MNPHNYFQKGGCDICGKKRSVGDHTKCSRLRQQRHAAARAQEKSA